ALQSISADTTRPARDRSKQRRTVGYGSAQTGPHSRSGERRICQSCRPAGAGISKDEPKFHIGDGAAAREFAHRRAIQANRLGDVGRGNSRFTDRVRERYEHAVRPGCIASKRTRDSRRARGDALATCQADVDRKFGGRGTGSSLWSSFSLLERGLVDPRDGRAAIWVRIAVLGSIYNRR